MKPFVSILTVLFFAAPAIASTTSTSSHTNTGATTSTVDDQSRSERQEKRFRGQPDLDPEVSRDPDNHLEPIPGYVWGRKKSKPADR